MRMHGDHIRLNSCLNSNKCFQWKKKIKQSFYINKTFHSIFSLARDLPLGRSQFVFFIKQNILRRFFFFFAFCAPFAQKIAIQSFSFIGCFFFLFSRSHNKTEFIFEKKKKRLCVVTNEGIFKYAKCALQYPNDIYI